MNIPGLTPLRQELGLGVYDALSGIVTQPIKGAREGGQQGMYKGIGKGLGGLLFKPLAGVFQLRPALPLQKREGLIIAVGVGGIFGYTFQGIYEDVRKKYGTGIDAQLRASRMVQGYAAAKKISIEKQQYAAQRWVELRRGPSREQ